MCEWFSARGVIAWKKTELCALSNPWVGKLKADTISQIEAKEDVKTITGHIGARKIILCV